MTIVWRRLRKLHDADDEPMNTLEVYRDLWENSFAFTFVEPDELTEQEQAVYLLAKPLLRLAGITRLGSTIRSVRISTTMRLDDSDNPCVGIWDPADRRLIIRRDQLADRARYAGTLLHEATHATSGAADYSSAFEDALTALLGRIAAGTLADR